MIRSKTALAHGVEWVWQGAKQPLPQVPPRHWEHTPGVTYPTPGTHEATTPPTAPRTITHTPPPAAEWATIEQVAPLLHRKISTARVILWQSAVRTIHCPPRTYYNRADIAAYLATKDLSAKARAAAATPPEGWLTIAQAAALRSVSAAYIRRCAACHLVRTMPKPTHRAHKWYHAQDIARLPAPTPRGKACALRARDN